MVNGRKIGQLLEKFSRVLEKKLLNGGVGVWE
jgi:hypothetical protein